MAPAKRIDRDYRFVSSDSHAQSPLNRNQTDPPRTTKEKQTAPGIRQTRSPEASYYTASGRRSTSSNPVSLASDQPHRSLKDNPLRPNGLIGLWSYGVVSNHQAISAS